MKKYLLFGVVVITSSFLFTGCVENQPTVNLHRKETNRIFLEPVAPIENKTFSKIHEKEHECAMHTYLYLAARESLKEGYKYFILDDPGYGWKYDNNMLGFPITSGEAYDRYCNPANKEPDTGLEDDKCMYRRMFDHIATHYEGHILMLKEPTYLFPTWDAKQTLKEEEPKVNQCIDWGAYKNASSAKDIKLDE